MGIMHFSAQPIPEVEEFVRKHYKGGTIIDFGCGCGRYAHLFPDDSYLGVDGHEGNVSVAKAFKGKKCEVHDLETWKPKEKFDYLFSSVVFDQVENLPKGWAKTYLLIEPGKYREHFEVEVDEPLECSEGTRMVVAHDLPGV